MTHAAPAHVERRPRQNRSPAIRRPTLPAHVSSEQNVAGARAARHAVPRRAASIGHRPPGCAGRSPDQPHSDLNGARQQQTATNPWPAVTVTANGSRAELDGGRESRPAMPDVDADAPISGCWWVPCLLSSVSQCLSLRLLLPAHRPRGPGGARALSPQPRGIVLTRTLTRRQRAEACGERRPDRAARQSAAPPHTWSRRLRTERSRAAPQAARSSRSFAAAEGGIGFGWWPTVAPDSEWTLRLPTPDFYRLQERKRRPGDLLGVRAIGTVGWRQSTSVPSCEPGANPRAAFLPLELGGCDATGRHPRSASSIAPGIFVSFCQEPGLCARDSSQRWNKGGGTWRR